MARIFRCAALAVALGAAACVPAQSGYAIGPADDRTTKSVQVGSELRLSLPAEFDWNVEPTDTRALALKGTAVGNVGGAGVRIWTFDVTAPGEFVLRATGDPACRKATPPCAAPTVRYEFTIQARS